MDEAAIIALIAALFGGAGLKIIETLLNRGRRRDDLASNLREELRTDLKEIRELLTEAYSELDDWKARYYALMESYNRLKFKLLQEGVPLNGESGDGDDTDESD